MEGDGPLNGRPNSLNCVLMADDVVAADSALIRLMGMDATRVHHVREGAQFIGNMNPADMLKRLQGLSEFTSTAQFQQLAIAFKRVRNIGREVQPAVVQEHERAHPDLRSLLTEPAEQALFDEIAQRRPQIERAIHVGDEYRAAFAEAAKFEPSVRRFFDDVMVMVPDVTVRGARLRVLKQLENLILQLADISQTVVEEKQA